MLLFLLAACQGNTDAPAKDDTGAEADADTDADADSDTDADTDTDTDADSDTDSDTDTDTDPPADDGWPARFFAPYVDATAYPTVKIGEIPAENGVLRYTLGFVVAESAASCNATWGTYYTIETGPSAWDGGGEYFLYDQIDTLRGLGGDVMVSFGGAANTPIEAACATVDEVVDQYDRVIDALALTRIDFDVEGYWLAEPTSIERRSQAIAQLQAERAATGWPLHVWFTLPVLPSGLTADGIAVLQSALDHGVVIDGVNVMTMNYGDGTAPDPDGAMGAYGIDAVTALHAQLDALYGGAKTEAELWAMIGSTPMIGLNDVTTETFYVEDAEETLAFAESVGMGMLGMWSTNRDHPCDQAWVALDCNSLADVEDWAFSKVFAAYE